jgi:hypothetical protein
MSFRRKLELIGFYTTSLLQNRRNAEYFRGIQTYCMFVGYPRTGHSLIGSLLDAHPRVVIAHELNALKALDKHIDRFFQLCSGVERLKNQNQDLHIYDLRLESFIEDPKSGLADLCSFLGIKAEASYLEDCASIVFPSPKKSRFDIEWSREAIGRVRERMEAFNSLSGYAYDEEYSHQNVPVGIEEPQRRRSVASGAANEN